MNRLEITGKCEDLKDFRIRNARTVANASGAVVLIPLCFGQLLPRPVALDGVEESSVGLRGYQALYGDWKALLDQRWIKERGAVDRASLIRLLEQLDPNHFYLAQTYRRNECVYGFRNWYAWNLKHYGTKCDLGPDTKVQEDGEEKLIYLFDTFEHPPMPWFEILAGTFSRLTMKLSHRNPWKLAQAAMLY